MSSKLFKTFEFFAPKNAELQNTFEILIFRAKKSNIFGVKIQISTLTSFQQNRIFRQKD